jgi:hypothetical protein
MHTVFKVHLCVHVHNNLCISFCVFPCACKCYTDIWTPSNNIKINVLKHNICGLCKRMGYFIQKVHFSNSKPGSLLHAKARTVAFKSESNATSNLKGFVCPPGTECRLLKGRQTRQRPEVDMP